ncbi:uncharacterized protein LOC113944927 isoform X1 [Corapipo altera]|uniref:uncharacterized protein LOC113944927 isoform X1 n=1 Tax=Corapipo altera TaxID=415028 RepID=UPI000FD636DB|nr:uncharacterized protein LOC113944927 isoform X1 [Corapipo altera]
MGTNKYLKTTRKKKKKGGKNPNKPNHAGMRITHFSTGYALCDTFNPPHSSSKLRAELREGQAALPPPKNCTNATSKSFSQEKPYFCTCHRLPKARGGLGPPPRFLHALVRPGSARFGSLPARWGLPAAETPRSSGAGGASCLRTDSDPLSPAARRCLPGTGTAETKPVGHGAAWSDSVVLPAPCRAPGCCGRETGAVRDRGTRRCRSEGRSPAVREG